MSKSKSIHLAADLSHYHTDYLWMLPGSWRGYSYYSGPEFYEDIARTAARGVMDMLFFGDSGGTPEDYGGNHHTAGRYGTKWPRHDMMPMIPCMSRGAEGVGFGITMSTTYHHPFHIARVFNGLDHVTKGRIAWNAVTSRSKNEAANYGYKKMIEHDERYDRAQEHLGICLKLWDSIEPDAIVLDRERRIFGDPSKVHLINHEGEHYSVRGPLPALPSPQRRPIIIQAGQSGPGMDLAAHYADMQFSTRRTLPSMKEHRARLDQKLASFGRKPEDCGILWSVRIQVADSEEQARAMAKEGKAVVWIDGGLHATEVLGAQQLGEMVYQMVSRTDDETMRVLNDCIILFVHANPDGNDLTADWYMRNPVPEQRSMANLPRLYQKYIGHDNNREFFTSTQAETENINRV